MKITYDALLEQLRKITAAAAAGPSADGILQAEIANAASRIQAADFTPDEAVGTPQRARESLEEMIRAWVPGEFHQRVEHALDQVAGASAQQLAAPSPKVLINLGGGLVNLVTANMPVRIVILDADTEGGDPESIGVINGEKVYIYDYALTDAWAHGVDPNKVDEAFAEVDLRERLAQQQLEAPRG